jgi:hypothetical protein
MRRRSDPAGRLDRLRRRPDRGRLARLIVGCGDVPGPVHGRRIHGRRIHDRAVRGYPGILGLVQQRPVRGADHAGQPVRSVQQRVEHLGQPGPQTICGNSESNWEVTSNQRAGNTAVLTYPSVQVNYNSQDGYALSRFSSMTSSGAEQMPSVSGLDAEAAYDIWLNDLNKEVMVWVDNHGQTPAGSKVAAYSVSGATWDLYVTGDNSYLAFVRQGNANSGSVDLLALLKYLERRGLLSSSDTLWQVNFGFEISSTGGRPASFSVTHYSLHSTPSS